MVAAARASHRERPASENPYALQPDTLDLLEGLLESLSPKAVVEFGSGASTAVFARWAAEHRARLISIEHDRQWADRVRTALSASELAATDLRHAPLRLTTAGLRAFLTYQGLEELGAAIAEAGLILIDGPHVSGREPVIYAVLSGCNVGATIVIDDFRHYAIREMLTDVDAAVAQCFAGLEIDDNSHGVCVLRCERPPARLKLPNRDLMAVMRSYWRCFRDYRQYGSGA
jgi:predicted O-methyltransferase YrrM